MTRTTWFHSQNLTTVKSIHKSISEQAYMVTNIIASVQEAPSECIYGNSRHFINPYKRSSRLNPFLKRIQLIPHLIFFFKNISIFKQIFFKCSFKITWTMRNVLKRMKIQIFIIRIMVIFVFKITPIFEEFSPTTWKIKIGKLIFHSFSAQNRKKKRKKKWKKPCLKSLMFCTYLTSPISGFVMDTCANFSISQKAAALSKEELANRNSWGWNCTYLTGTRLSRSHKKKKINAYLTGPISGVVRNLPNISSSQKATVLSREELANKNWWGWNCTYL